MNTMNTEPNVADIVYNMLINNLKTAIRKPNPVIDAFQASTVLAIGFAKLKEEVIADLIKND